MKPISERIEQPNPEAVREARKRAGLTQAEAARLVSAAEKMPYRSWQSYEVATGQKGAREIPLPVWELFLLLTDQHQTMRLVRRRGARTGKSGYPAEQQPAASNKEDAPRIRYEGDTWRVIGMGAKREDGKVYCHLASETRGRRQKNGWVPVQIADWVALDPLLPSGKA